MSALTKIKFIPEVIVITDQDTVKKMADAVVKQAPNHFILLGHSLGGSNDCYSLSGKSE